MKEVLAESGLPDAQVFTDKRDVVLPGFFRPTKEWDLVAVADDTLIACIEFKSQVGSFGNNFNNRTEEALGNASDILTAYREGAFATSAKPWLGYFMMIEESANSTQPVGVREPHFPVFDEFRDTSYADRYALLCEKLVRERLYDAACFIMSNAADVEAGEYREPNPEVGFKQFATSLMGHAMAFAKMREA